LANWGLYDHPEAQDVTQLTGLLNPDGRTKAWGHEFKRLSAQHRKRPVPPSAARPILDWDACLTSTAAGSAFREQYLNWFIAPQARP
jgi:hypothetical protein